MVAQVQKHEPLYDIVPETGASIEVFYSDRTMETFGRAGAGWFWWPRRLGLSPEGPATGPFATSYAAYRHAMTSQQNRWYLSTAQLVHYHGRLLVKCSLCDQ
jgi:hypothetical protein